MTVRGSYGVPPRPAWQGSGPGDAPTSGVSRRTVLLCVLAAVVVAGAIVFGWQWMQSDVSKKLARWDKLKAAGRNDEADKVMGDVLDAGMKLYYARRFDEATRVFERVLEKDPKKPLALDYLGVMARDRGDETKAIEYFKKAAELDPLSPLHYYNLALIYFNRKDYEYAEVQLQDAMRVSVKAQYRLLYALCAIERKETDDVIRKRLRDTIECAVAQATSVNSDELAPGGSLSTVWKKAAAMLASRGDNYGWDRLKALSTDAKKSEVRDFAKRVLAEKPAAK